MESDFYKEEFQKLLPFSPESAFRQESHFQIMHIANRGCGKCLSELSLVAALRRKSNGGCPRCGGRVRMNGKDRDGRQRYKCATCRKTYINTTAELTRRQREIQQKLSIATEMIIKGHSMRESSKAIGLNIRSMPKILGARCGCGRESGHKGWCAWRFARSERRQAFMRTFGNKKAIQQEA